MIDPNIALSFRPTNLGIDTPTQAMTANQQLTNLQNTGQLQQAELKTVAQEQQQRQMQLDAANALNSAIAQNTKTAPDGTIYTDHEGVLRSLSAAGQGTAAIEYQSQLAGMRKAQLDMQKLQDGIVADHASHIGALANSILGIQDPAAQAVAYQQGRLMALRNNWAQPNELPDQWNEQTKAGLQMIAQGAMTVQDQYKAKYGEERVQAYQGLADARRAQAQAADDRAKAAELKANQGNWSYVGTRNGQAVYLNKTDGSERVGGKIDDDPNAAKGTKVTADASLADRRANEKDYETNAAAETKAAQEKSALETALTNGKVYVDAKGTITPFSKMKDANGDPIGDDDIAALKQEMQNRLAIAQKSIETAVANKNNAMQRNGVKPQVSTEQAIQAYRGGATPTSNPAPKTTPGSASPQPAKTPAKAPAGDPNQQVKVQLPNGQWLSGPRSKVDAYLKTKNLQLQQ